MPSVSAAVFRDGERCWEQALGLADVEPHEQATPQTQYRIGSITKTFTAVGIAAAARRGPRSSSTRRSATTCPRAPLGPTDPAGALAPLGLQREPPGEIWETMKAPSPRGAAGRDSRTPSVLDPGFRWHYSNLAFALLGEVVARAHGGTVGGGAPGAGARAARAAPDDARRDEPAARGYFVEPYSDGLRARAGRRRSPRRAPRWGSSGRRRATSPAGARSSSAGDERVLQQATLDEMSHVRTMVDHAGWKLAWGLGLELYRRGDRVFVGHGGAMPGFLAGSSSTGRRRSARPCYEHGRGANPERLALDLGRAAIEPPAPAEPWLAGDGAPAEIEPLLGRWWTEGHQIVFSMAEGRLEAQLVGGVPGRDTSFFEPDGEDRFRSRRGPRARRAPAGHARRRRAGAQLLRDLPARAARDLRAST